MKIIMNKHQKKIIILFVVSLSLVTLISPINGQNLNQEIVQIDDNDCGITVNTISEDVVFTVQRRGENIPTQSNMTLCRSDLVFIIPSLLEQFIPTILTCPNGNIPIKSGQWWSVAEICPASSPFIRDRNGERIILRGSRTINFISPTQTTLINQNQIEFIWEQVEGADYYIIWIKQDNSPFLEKQIVETNQFIYTENLPSFNNNGEEYSFYVEARDPEDNLLSEGEFNFNFPENNLLTGSY